MRRRYTPPAPLQRGGSGAAFLSVVRDLMVWRIPLSRGDQGVCYGERRGVAEVFLLLFGEVVFLGLQ